MTKKFTLYLERRRQGEIEIDRRRVTVEPLPMTRGELSKPQLMLQILGADQSASEFLDQKQFEEMVANGRRVMGWEGDRLVMEGKPVVST